MKYIIFEDVNLLIFPGFMTHREVALHYGIDRATSAGFVDIDNRLCYGESTSLELKSRPGDSAILKVAIENCDCGYTPAQIHAAG